MTIAEQIIAAATGETAILTAVGVAAAAGVSAIWASLVDHKPAGNRAKALLQRREALARKTLAPGTRSFAPKGLTLARRLVNRFKLMGSHTSKEAQLKLERAGLRTRDALTMFLAAKLCLPLTFGVTTAILIMGLEILGPMPQALSMSISALAVGVGYIAPDVYCKNMAEKRKQILRRMLPDALDLMVICTEAGLNLDSAFKRVAREMEAGCPEIADEFELTAVELGFLQERREALSNLERRCDLPAMTALTGTLSQAERYGTPLAQSLRVLAAEVRDQRLMKAEEKAARLPAILTVPMVVFILPALFIVLIGPGILRTVDALMTL